MNSFDALFNWKPQNGSGSSYVCPDRRTRYLSFYFRASHWSLLLYRRKPTNSNLFPNLKNWTEVYFLWETSMLAALHLTDPVYVFKAPWGNKISITCGGGDTQSSLDCGAWYVLRRWWQGMRRWWGWWGFRKWTEIRLIWSSICNWIHTTCISSVFKVFRCVSFSLHCLFHLIGSFRCRRSHQHHPRFCTTTWWIFTWHSASLHFFSIHSSFVTQQLCDKTFTRTLEKSSIRGTKSRVTAAPFTAAGSTY